MLASLTSYTHEKFSGACVALGMPEPPGEDEGTKRQRVERSFAPLPDADLPMVAELILAGRAPLQLDAVTRNAIQDVLWAGQGALEMPARTWREIALDLDLDDLTIKPDRFMALLDRMWVLDTPGSDSSSFSSCRSIGSDAPGCPRPPARPPTSCHPRDGRRAPAEHPTRLWHPPR